MTSALSDLFRIDGKVACVTGGNSGIGRTMALTLGEMGAHVVVLARDPDRIAQTVRDLEALGARAAGTEVDVGDREAIARAITRAVEPFGAPDILVNAAGINERPPMSALSDDVWDRTMRVNLDAPFFFARALAPAMVERGWGRILNIASLQSVRALNNSGAYGVSKGGVAQMTRAMAECWSRQGVNCNAIAPGFFPTPLTRALFDNPTLAAALAAKTMIGRNGVLDDLRGITAFLASRASDYVTGQVVFVDGGFSAG